jgi:hypothetical protein
MLAGGSRCEELMRFTTASAGKENEGCASGDGLDRSLNDLNIQRRTGGYGWYIIIRLNVTDRYKMRMPLLTPVYPSV